MSLLRPIFAITAFLLLLGILLSNPKKKPDNDREKLQTNVSPESYKVTVHSLTNNNHSTFIIDLPPGFNLDNQQYSIPYDFTVHDKNGRKIRFQGNLKLVREDENTYIATPERDLAHVSGELLAHVVKNLGELIERKLGNLQNFTEGFEEGRR
jgi:hypothetical protein